MPFLTRNGVRLAYDLAEGHEVPVVLIHGWCCDRSFMADQFVYLAARGHTVLAMDLRGHGESDKPDELYTFEIFGDDVKALCEELGIARPVLAGHSMGGVVAFELAARFPDWPRALVMFDSAVAKPESARAFLATIVDQMEAADARVTLRHLINDAFFIPTDDTARRAHILDVMMAAPDNLLVSGAYMLRDHDPSHAKGRITAPTLFIGADEPSPRSDLQRLKEIVPQVEIGRTVGSGHFCQMEVPDQVNAMLAQFLKLNLREDGATASAP